MSRVYESQGLCTSISLIFKLASHLCQPVSPQGKARPPLATELKPAGPALSVPIMRITESLLHKCPPSLCLLTQPVLSEVPCNASFLSGTTDNKLPCTVLAPDLLALPHLNNHASGFSLVRETNFLLQLTATYKSSCLSRSCCHRDATSW